MGGQHRVFLVRGDRGCKPGMAAPQQLGHDAALGLGTGQGIADFGHRAGHGDAPAVCAHAQGDRVAGRVGHKDRAHLAQQFAPRAGPQRPAGILGGKPRFGQDDRQAPAAGRQDQGCGQVRSQQKDGGGTSGHQRLGHGGGGIARVQDAQVGASPHQAALHLGKGRPRFGRDLHQQQGAAALRDFGRGRIIGHGPAALPPQAELPDAGYLDHGLRRTWAISPGPPAPRWGWRRLPRRAGGGGGR